ncbi:hypothetical protein CCAX7_003640 [Capsulimonas corticalis]|uniref:Malectin domain-containing protein n=1 Tax=Capsulimonas corticalis TaxID=2219043 RepID=A0A402CSA3_9BACT|nr:carboxypeptidase regulatory-like domain-containing protein [Capsulimonas corticalis]BDI28313.1 hypothetical protein CCAX7_003640 [Capsulimonas corticalis]
MNAQRHLRIATIASIFLFLVLAGFALFAGTTTSIAARGNTGKALAFQTLLASDKSKLLAASALAGHNPLRGADGRYLMSPSLLRPRHNYSLRSHATPIVDPVVGPVQTFDTFAPGDSFTPVDGEVRQAANFFPVWTNDEQYILFASNRDPQKNDGSVGADPKMFHIWAVPANGGKPIQITNSAANANENGGLHGELYPALSPGDNTQLAFTSDANSVNFQHLYVIPFQPSQTVVNVTGLTGFNNALTLRQDQALDFDYVGRPTWGGGGQIAFAARTNIGTYQGHIHIYILNVASHGYLNSPYPAKLTNGPADDNNPTWSPDSQYIAFDSTASGVTPNGSIQPGVPPGNGNPGTLDASPVLTTAGGTLHNIIMLRSNGSIPTALVASNGVITTPGNDDVTPSWSSGNTDPYSNPRGDTDYLAFARGASPSSPHDIYYFQASTEVFTSGVESGPSNTLTVVPANADTPLLQLNSGSNTAVGTFIPDTPFVSASSVGVYPATNPAINTAGTPNPAPAAVYQTYRTATGANPNFTYTLLTPAPNATYHIRLHFAEPTATGPGQRVFNILINGAPVQTNYDIFNQTGGLGIATQLDNSSVQSDANGLITVTFESVTGNAIVNGLELLSSGGTVTSIPPSANGAPTISGVLTGQVVTISWAPVAGASSYNIYRKGPADTTFKLYRVRYNKNPETFVDGPLIPGFTYSYFVTSVKSDSSTTQVNTEGSGSLNHLNTQSSGSYSNYYPAWSPFRSIYSIVYQSNRSVTYNQADGAPSETDISLPQGNANPAIGSGYVGLLQSQVLDVDPPILQRFNEKEIVHINVGNQPILPSATDETGSAKRDIPTSAKITFTVRMSDRVSGTSKVFIQIKDPDSKYQDKLGREHKLFAPDPDTFDIPNNLPNPKQTAANYLFNAKGVYDQIVGGRFIGDDRNVYGYQVFNGGRFDQHGMLAGNDGQFNISIGTYQGPAMSAYVTNVQTLIDLFQDGTPAKPLKGGDPTKFYAYGAEYECEYLNPTVATPGNNSTDYGTPYYVAGIDDRKPFTGDDVTLDNQGNLLHADDGATRGTGEWLPLTLSPVQDNKGGKLYSGTWTSPDSVSDYYLDVIAYNDAVYPFSGNVNTDSFTHGNWRIYDNVWGCSSQPLPSNKDILVVSDNMLGQKFTGTSFGGHQTFFSNLRPIYYGAESYVTDVDVNILPNCSYYWDSKPSVYIAPMFISPLNGLGVDSYYDETIDDGGRTQEQSPAGTINDPVFYPLVKSQQYAIWRTLCHDPIDSSVLSIFGPNKTLEPQPAIVDTALGLNAPATSVPVATRCVLWFSPFTNDLFVGDGTLSDPNIQATLSSFVAGGGRLLVSGQDVVSQSSNSASSNFVSNTLNVALTNPAGGTPAMSAGADNILGFGNSWLSNSLSNSLNWRTDGSLNEITTNPIPFFRGLDNTFQLIEGAIDTVSPNTQNGAKTDLTFTGGKDAGIVYTENLASNGSRVVYASFGLESISQEVVKVGDGIGDDPRKYHFETKNYRTNTIHNIISYLRTGSFTGFVREGTTTGTGVAGAVVYVVPVGGQLGSRAAYTALTGSAGNFAIDGVPPGVYKIYAAKHGYKRFELLATDTFTVEGDVNVPVTLPIQTVDKGSIIGKVTDFYTGSPVSGASVVFTAADDSTVSFSASTDANGIYRITSIPTFGEGRVFNGVASLKPTYPDSTAQAVTILPGQTVDGTLAAADANAKNADFALKPTPGTVTGRVFDNATNAGIGGATITVAINQILVPQTVITKADGTYTISLGPGTYTLTAKAPGYGQKSRLVAVTSGGTLSGQDFGLDKIPPGYVGGSVINAATGQPVLGLSVQFFSTDTNTLTATFTTGATKSPVAPAGDGKPLNYVGSIPEGTYTVVATDPTLGPAVAATGTITVTRNAFTRADLTFSLGTLGGLVKAGPNSPALSGVTVTITTAAGGAVATLTTGAITSPAAPAGDGSPINYQKFLPPGDYLVTFSKSGYTTSAALPVTVTLGAFKRQDYIFPVVTTFPAGLQMISAPYDYGNFSLDTLFGTDRSKLVIWQPQLLQYVVDPTPPADSLHLGYGYWIKLPRATDISFKGTAPTTTTVDIPLHAFWNQIGVPSTTAIDITKLTFLNPATPTQHLSYADAISTKYNVISPTIYGYDPATNSYVKATTLQPWHGYWIKAYIDTTVYIPTAP